MSRYSLTQAATRDVLTIYIQSHDLFGAGQAARYQSGLKLAFERLAAFPQSAQGRPGLPAEVRVLPHQSHAILYRANGNDVLILRVRHGAEDWQSDPINPSDLSDAT